MATARARNALSIFATLATAGFATGAHAGPRGIVELFTSQGCSSCPPADALLEKLGREGDLITLTLPVDYWDRLGWKDTLAQPAFTARQKAYAAQRGDGEIYTPQAVINGSAHVVGSRRSDIEAAAARTQRSLVVPLTIERSGEDYLIRVGQGPADAGPATLVVMPVTAAKVVAIGRGENARRTVTYTNVVGTIMPLGDWTGAPLTHRIPARAFEGFDGFVAVLQKGSPRSPGAIIGAAEEATGARAGQGLRRATTGT